MAGTRIQLCGRVIVSIDGSRAEDRLPGRQGRLLFVYLATNRRRATPRDALVDALWGDAAPANVGTALSALLSKLRRVVPLEGRSDVRLALAEDAWIDLEAAQEGLHRAESAVARGDWTSAWGPSRVAQHVCARGFLLGEDAPWINAQRRRIEEMEISALELVAQACVHIGGGELATAERAARKLVERAPYRESGYRALMEVLAAADNTAEALRVYEQLRSRLREDLGAAPSPATQTLHRKLLA